MNNPPPAAKTAFSDDRYSVINELGRGGMGTVYKCLDVKLNTEVAVKVVSFTFSPSEVARFHKEAKALAKLNHPNILTVRDFGYSNDGTVFLVTDIVRGEGIDSVIESGGAIPLEGALPMCLQICDGLAHAHKNGILHRDLKPSNIMIAATGKEDDPHIVKLMDFGLAKLQLDDQRLTKTGAMVGSPAYMSPEQADGKPTDERSDIYSLGCLMYEVLTGEQPFTAGSIPALMLAQINKPAPKLVDKLPDMIFPVELEELIAKCLAKKKEDRFQNVIELRNAVASVDEQLRATNAIYLSGAIGLSGVYNRTGGFLRADNAQINAAKFKRLPFGALVGIMSLALLVLAGFFYFTLQRAEIFKPVVKADPVEARALERNEHEFSVPDGRGSVRKSRVKTTPTLSKPGESDEWTTVGSHGTDKKLYELLDSKQVDYLNLSDSDVTDQGVLSLASKPIIGLRLERTEVTDKALAELGKMKKLEELSLKGCKNITDESLKAIVGLRKFEFVDISDTNLSDTVFFYLGGCKQLRTVIADNCKNITGSGFGDLKSTMINSLILKGSGIKCANLVNLERVPMLATIDLSNNDLTDQDLDYMGSLEFVCSIDLSKNPRITNTGFLKLLRMPCVHTIKILECKGITKLGVDKFMTERIGTILVWDKN